MAPRTAAEFRMSTHTHTCTNSCSPAHIAYTTHMNARNRMHACIKSSFSQSHKSKHSHKHSLISNYTVTVWGHDSFFPLYQLQPHESLLFSEMTSMDKRLCPSLGWWVNITKTFAPHKSAGLHQIHNWNPNPPFFKMSFVPQMSPSRQGFCHHAGLDKQSGVQNDKCWSWKCVQVKI